MEILQRNHRLSITTLCLIQKNLSSAFSAIAAMNLIVISREPRTQTSNERINLILSTLHIALRAYQTYVFLDYLNFIEPNLQLYAFHLCFISHYSFFFCSAIGQPIGVGPSGPPSPVPPVSEEHLYTVTVYTGSVSGAETTANVYLTIYGKKGSTNEVHLKKGGKKLFGKGQ